MDWSEERYVRLYTRDTTTWKLLGWEGATVLALLLRKLDRGGCLPLEGLSPVDAIQLHTGLPYEVAVTGWTILSRREVFRTDGVSIVMPNFREAQEARPTAAQRKRLERERRAANVTKRDNRESQAVTKSAELSQPEIPRDQMSQMSLQPSLASLANPQGGDGKSQSVTSDPPVDPVPGGDVAGVYAKVTGNTDVDPVSPAWPVRVADAIRTMRTWAHANGGLDGLETELRALLAQDDRGWLQGQAVHIWAQRVGTSSPAPNDPASSRRPDLVELP